ncbi:MAG: DUF3332 domain-containing protein [bacterium]|nr:DUF3332 domain-containing protein [bacterium]
MRSFHWRKWGAIGISCAVLVGCYGRFPLTNTLYDWNGSVTHHRVGQSLIMWLLVILPVYQACMIVDGVIINTIEYLSGRQVIASSGRATRDGMGFELLNPTNAVLHIPLQDGGSIPVSLIRVAPTRCELRDQQSTLLGTAMTTSDGSLQLCDAQGKVIAWVPASDLRVVCGGRD